MHQSISFMVYKCATDSRGGLRGPVYCFVSMLF